MSKIRVAKPTDAKLVHGIYSPIVTNTAISFENDVPPVEEIQNRIEKTLVQYPCTICIEIYFDLR